MGAVRIPAGALGAWAGAALRRSGASADAAAATACCLVDASRRGFDTHGVVLLEWYVSRLRSGAVNGAARPSVVVDAPALALVDGDNGLGPYVGAHAIDLCCAKADAAGAAVVVTRNGNHFGATSCAAGIPLSGAIVARLAAELELPLPAGV